MKHYLPPVVLAILFALLMAGICQFVGWSHPSTWEGIDRAMAAFLTVLAGAVGALLGAYLSERNRS